MYTEGRIGGGSGDLGYIWKGGGVEVQTNKAKTNEAKKQMHEIETLVRGGKEGRVERNDADKMIQEGKDKGLELQRIESPLTTE